MPRLLETMPGVDTAPKALISTNGNSNGVKLPTNGSATTGTYDLFTLLLLAETVDDFERARIALDNRILAVEKKEDKCPVLLRALSMQMHDHEDEAIKALQKEVRKHPLGEFVKRTIGLGEKQVARLLAAIGDPGARETVSQLWQYCGHGDPERSHARKGAVRIIEGKDTTDGKKIAVLPYSPVAKMRVRLIALSCIKQMDSPYRPIYEREKAKWADRDVSDGHKHNHALRVVGKEILKDMWIESRR